MTKVDFKKELKDFYSAKKDKIAVVEVPKMKFLAIDGMGDPETSQGFQDAVAALYGVAYTAKFSMKAAPPKGYFEFVVPPLEALWWMDPGPFDPQAKDKWQWRMLVMQPDFVTGRVVDQAIVVVAQYAQLFFELANPLFLRIQCLQQQLLFGAIAIVCRSLVVRPCLRVVAYFYFLHAGF